VNAVLSLVFAEDSK